MVASFGRPMKSEIHTMMLNKYQALAPMTPSPTSDISDSAGNTQNSENNAARFKLKDKKYIQFKESTFSMSCFEEPQTQPGFANGPFRKNVKSLIRNFAQGTCLFPFPIVRSCDKQTWQVNIRDTSGLTIPLQLSEEKNTNRWSDCADCRCVGWGHHPPSIHDYHFVVQSDPADDSTGSLGKGRKKCGTCFEIIPASVKLCVYCGEEAVKVGQWEGRGSQESRILLHGVIHGNGYGHLIAVNGEKEGREKRKRVGQLCLSDDQLMALWNNICWMLNAKKVSLHDSPQKKGMELKLIHAVIHGESWSSQWGYKCISDKYKRALKFIHRLPLQILLKHFEGVDTESLSIIAKYMERFKIHTLGEIFSVMIVNSNPDEHQFQSTSSLREHEPFEVEASVDTRQKKSFASSIRHESGKEKVTYDEISSSRWSKKRLQTAEKVIMGALQKCQDRAEEGGEEGWLPRHKVREKARETIGDTGLIDFVLKSIGNRVIGGFVVRRTVNPANKVLQFRLEEADQSQDSILGDEEYVDPPVTPDAKMRKRKVFETGQIHGWESEAKRDLLHLYNSCLQHYLPSLLPAPSQSVTTVANAVQSLLDATHFLKDLEEESAIIRKSSQYDAYIDDYLLQVRCRLSLDVEIPAELVVLPLHATVADLRMEVARAFRETYVGMQEIKVENIMGLNCDDDLLFGLLDSCNDLSVKVSGVNFQRESTIDLDTDDWTVGCLCGVNDDDGEPMVACDLCGKWQHMRCYSILDAASVPSTFLCQTCRRWSDEEVCT